MHNPNFYTIDTQGRKVLRNPQKENTEREFTIEKFWNRQDGLDDINYMYFENYEMHGQFDSRGSDYERYGCILEENDVVVDIGANIGMFTRRALERGASRVISFEPMSIKYSCLVDNVGFSAECHKVAIGNSFSISNFTIPDSISNLGGGSREDLVSGREITRKEICLTASMEDLWKIGMIPEKIDFLKIDCEGGEAEIIPQLSEERLSDIRKISMEYHQGLLGPELREEFTSKARSLGFESFTLFHGDGSLVQLHLWK